MNTEITPMKLSQAIREGAKLRPQCMYSAFGMVRTETQWCTLGSCALGAAYEAFYQKSSVADTELLPQLQKATGIDFTARVWHPEREQYDDLSEVITDLNDVYKYSREHIADWLSKIGY